MTISEVIKEFVAYYGDWINDSVQARVIAEIMQYSECEFEGIKNEVMRDRPAQWGAPDVSAIAKAIKSISEKRTPILRSGERSGTIICPVCRNVIRGTGGFCHTCAYVLGDDVEEHAEWWKRYQEGDEQFYSLGSMIDGILAQKSIRQIDESKAKEKTAS